MTTDDQKQLARFLLLLIYHALVLGSLMAAQKYGPAEIQPLLWLGQLGLFLLCCAAYSRTSEYLEKRFGTYDYAQELLDQLSLVDQAKTTELIHLVVRARDLPFERIYTPRPQCPIEPPKKPRLYVISGGKTTF